MTTIDREAIIRRLRAQEDRAMSVMERIADQGSIEAGNDWAIDEHHEACELAETARLAIDALLALVPEPADDEREALANLIPLNLVGDRSRPGFPADVFEAADRILAAGYRKVQ